MGNLNSILAGTCTIKDLFSFEKNYTISIPDYQRAYVWDIKKVESLINDIESFYKDNAKEIYYYLGSILFYKKDKSTYEVIDGQQRLTTLLIIDYVTNKSDSILKTKTDLVNFIFNSPISQNNIIKNKDFLIQEKNNLKDKKWLDIFSKLVVSVVITDNQDDAFTFFDTQNHRGIKLSAVDYLKSYHLRELKEELGKQEIFAKKWDYNNQNQFLNLLYHQILWRSRMWKGRDVRYENNDMLLNEFQEKTQKPEINNRINIYSNKKNRIAKSLEFNEYSGITLQTLPISLQTKAIDFPLELRQPIEKGIGFFLYTEKYVEVYNHLFETRHNIDSEIGLFQDFYEKVYLKADVSDYLKMLFKLSITTYYDKYEDYQLYPFALWLDFLIGSYRIKLDSIVELTPVKIIRDENQNLLDIILHSYQPNEVFQFIKKITDNEIYKTEKVVIEFKTQHRVKERYKKALLNYYSKGIESNLLNKKNWINDRVKDYK